MEQVTKKQEIKEVITHTFHCDDCNEFLGESVEQEDGYYERLGGFTHKIQVGKNQLEKISILCDNCILKHEQAFIEAVKKLGYQAS